MQQLRAPINATLRIPDGLENTDLADFYQKINNSAGFSLATSASATGGILSAYSGRSEFVVEEQADLLVATLMFLSGDLDKAARDIDVLCKQFGVKRDFVLS